MVLYLDNGFSVKGEFKFLISPKVRSVSNCSAEKKQEIFELCKSVLCTQIQYIKKVESSRKHFRFKYCYEFIFLKLILWKSLEEKFTLFAAVRPFDRLLRSSYLQLVGNVRTSRWKLDFSRRGGKVFHLAVLLFVLSTVAASNGLFAKIQLACFEMNQVQIVYALLSPFIWNSRKKKRMRKYIQSICLV